MGGVVVARFLTLGGSSGNDALLCVTVSVKAYNRRAKVHYTVAVLFLGGAAFELDGVTSRIIIGIATSFRVAVFAKAGHFFSAFASTVVRAAIFSPSSSLDFMFVPMVVPMFMLMSNLVRRTGAPLVLGRPIGAASGTHHIAVLLSSSINLLIERECHTGKERCWELFGEGNRLPQNSEATLLLDVESGGVPTRMGIYRGYMQEQGVAISVLGVPDRMTTHV